MAALQAKLKEYEAQNAEREKAERDNEERKGEPKIDQKSKAKSSRGGFFSSIKKVFTSKPSTEMNDA